MRAEAADPGRQRGGHHRPRRSGRPRDDGRSRFGGVPSTARPFRHVALLGASLPGCSPGVLDPAGPVGAGERIVLLNSLSIMLAVAVPTILALVSFAWWFRAGNGKAARLPDWCYSGRLELLVWSVPSLVVIFLGGVAWIGSHRLAPERPLDSRVRPVPVQVVALDWKWLFIYPEQGVATVNRLVVPAGTPIAFRVTSATVMNSFFVPRLGGQVYAMSGMDARLNLQADRTGRFMGLSAHYSGGGFADMDFAVHAVAPSLFAAWADRIRADPAKLDRARFARLAGLSATSEPLEFGGVEPHLYEIVLATSVAPGAGTLRSAQATTR